MSDRIIPTPLPRDILQTPEPPTIGSFEGMDLEITTRPRRVRNEKKPNDLKRSRRQFDVHNKRIKTTNDVSSEQHAKELASSEEIASFSETSVSSRMKKASQPTIKRTRVQEASNRQNEIKCPKKSSKLRTQRYISKHRKHRALPSNPARACKILCSRLFADNNLDLKDKTFDELCARVSGIDPYAIEQFEKELFSRRRSPLAQKTIVKIRNNILQLWMRSPTKFLDIDDEVVMSHFPPRLHSDLKKIYWLLMIRGHINSGVFSGETTKRKLFIKHFPIIPRKRVLVVGAGPAGLAAARQLRQFGYHVTVLESRGRIGGRVFSQFISEGKIPIDFGASIITGLIGNPLAVPFQQLSIRASPIGDHAIIYDRNSGQAIDPITDANASKLFDSLLEVAWKKRSIKSRRTHDTALGQVIGGLIQDVNDLKQRALLEWYRANLEYSCGTDLDLLSNLHWDQDDQYEYTGSHLMLVDTYDSILKPIAKGTRILFNTEAKRISYNSNGVQIVSEDGKIFEGDAGLITASLGVLKAKRCQFIPPLPSWKRRAISNLGFGLLNKIILVFESAFWDTKLDWFGTVSQASIHKNKKEARGYAYLFWNMTKFVKAPVLVVLCSGESAYNVENGSEARTVLQITRVLKRAFRLEKLPKPAYSKVTKWSEDDFARGSYSYIAVGATADDYTRLAKPLGSIFFAGEATNRYHPTTVGGAYESGLREARRIHEFLSGRPK